MEENNQLELPIADAKPSPVVAVSRPVKKRLPLLLIGIVIAGVGSLMMLAASTRTAPTSTVDISEENRVKTASGLQHAAAAKDTSVPAMRTSAPRWVASGPSRRTANGLMFELSADEDIDVWRKRVRPVLTVRCSAKETEVFVVTQSAASIEPAGQHTVQLSFDDGGAADEMWDHSVDHDALFAPNPKGLLHQIAAAHRMSFRFSPFNAPAALVHFSVDGFEEQLKSAAKTCGWKR